MKNKIFRFLLLGVTLLTVVSACRKDEFVDEDNELGSGGKTMVKIPEGPLVKYEFLAFNTIRPLKGFSLRRDPNGNGELNTATTIEITVAAPPAGFEVLPEALYTLQSHSANRFVKTATGYKVDFAPGVFSAEFDINLDGAKFDLKKKYALSFTVSNPGNGTVTATNQKSINVTFAGKNIYDGIYSIAGGNVTRYVAGDVPAGDALSGGVAGNPDLTLATFDETTVEITGFRWAGGTSSVSGIEGFRAKVDPVTNLVTLTSTAAPTLKNIPGKPSTYDPATQTFTLNFEWRTVAATPLKREMTDLKFTYKAVRP